MADGRTKPIERIRLGDKVLATDSKTGLSAARPVVATVTGHGQKNLVQLTIDTDGPAGDQTGTITVTDGHSFWAPQPNRWVKTSDLTPGSWLQTSAGTWVQVVAARKWTASQRVHNLTIDTDHTYYVIAGLATALSHNDDAARSRIKRR